MKGICVQISSHFTCILFFSFYMFYVLFVMLIALCLYCAIKDIVNIFRFRLIYFDKSVHGVKPG